MFIKDLLSYQKKKEMRVKIILVLAPFSRKGTSTYFPKEVKQKDEIDPIIEHRKAQALGSRPGTHSCSVHGTNYGIIRVLSTQF